MILVFGGTTEGLKAVKELDEAGNPYFYSTVGSEQQADMRHGARVCGAMTDDAIVLFCATRGIRLLVDAAHPFAETLHRNVVSAAARLGIPAVRFERVYPDVRNDGRIEWCDSYDDAVERLKGVGCVLATTGAHSISKLKKLKNSGSRVYYRILDRPASVALAKEQGADAGELCFYGENEDNRALFTRLRPDIVLMKESGLSGGFMEKIRAAHEMDIRVMVIRRPPLPEGFVCVNGEHGLRRAVERLLPQFFPLHSGLTTGTCAAAAARAAASVLLAGEKPPTVPVTLPNGETIDVAVSYGDGYAYVVKDGGDDPDVTDGMEIRAEVRIAEGADRSAARPRPAVRILGGKGVGVFTIPGFDFPPGSPAINKTPRKMIETNIISALHPTCGLDVVISACGGEDVARRTFNPRLGIVGGISIVGVSGIVKPFSKESFIGSIHKCLEVATACHPERVVINSGAKSERYVKSAYPSLPPQAFVEYGNYIGETIRMAGELGVPRLTLGIMMGKAVKLAAGCLDTHSKRTTMDKNFIVSMLREAGCGEETVERARTMTLARELWEIVPAPSMTRFCDVVISHCMAHCKPLLPGGELTVLLVEETGRLHGMSGGKTVQEGGA